MLKKLLLVAKQQDVRDMYLKELQLLFDGYLEFLPDLYNQNKADSAFHRQLCQADIVLITNPYSLPLARSYMKETAIIITLNFTFEKSAVSKLRELPNGTEALVYFNYYSSSHQAAYTLYEAGLKNLNLYIHYPQNPNLTDKKIDVLIVSSNTIEIPTGIQKIIDLGDRKLSFPTILDIAIKSNTLDEELEDRIFKYCENICIPNDNLSYFYDSSAVSKMQLQTITNCIDYSIVILDHEYKIVNYNQNFVHMFEILNNISGHSIREISPLKSIVNSILSEHEFKNQLYELKLINKSLLVSKEKVNKRDKEFNVFIVLFKDVTDVINLENTLRKQLSKKGHTAKYHFKDIKGHCPAIVDSIAKANKIARIDKPTLIIGESGTGKELFAQSIHNASEREKYPFVAMNCAALPDNLLESELFGYADGAFTGAKKGGKLGLFQMAHRGTLFLDEIGELSLNTQAKLLRVLEEKEIMKVGSGEIISIDVRVIAATNKNLKALVSSGAFRLDLYYRLNTLIINVPSLKQRRDDILGLAQYFLDREHFSHIKISQEVVDFFKSYAWEGNIRELRNCIEYMANICDGIMELKHLPDYILEDAIPTPVATTSMAMAALNTKEKKLQIKILSLIKSDSTGRRAILEKCHTSRLPLTEYKLRHLLEQLKQQGYIDYGRGSTGSSITPEGELYLSHLVTAK